MATRGHCFPDLLSKSRLYEASQNPGCVGIDKSICASAICAADQRVLQQHGLNMHLDKTLAYIGGGEIAALPGYGATMRSNNSLPGHEGKKPEVPNWNPSYGSIVSIGRAKVTFLE